MLRLPKVEGALSWTSMCKQVSGEEKLRALQRGNSAEMCLWLCMRERERNNEIEKGTDV